MLRVSWTEKSTNESISLLVEIGHARRDMSLRQRAAKQKLMFYGHMMRANGMEKDMMLAYGEGKRKRDRPMKRWMEETLKMSGMNLAELRDAVEDRDLWTAEITKNDDRNGSPSRKFKVTR